MHIAVVSSIVVPQVGTGPERNDDMTSIQFIEMDWGGLLLCGVSMNSVC